MIVYCTGWFVCCDCDGLVLTVFLLVAYGFVGERLRLCCVFCC